MSLKEKIKVGALVGGLVFPQTLLLHPVEKDNFTLISLVTGRRKVLSLLLTYCFARVVQ